MCCTIIALLNLALQQHENSGENCKVRRNSWKVCSLLWWPVEQNGLICQSLCLALTWLIASGIYVYVYVYIPLSLGRFTLMDHSFKMIFCVSLSCQRGPTFFYSVSFIFSLLHSEVLQSQSSYSIALSSSSANTRAVIIAVSQQGCCKEEKKSAV